VFRRYGAYKTTPEDRKAAFGEGKITFETEILRWGGDFFKGKSPSSG
jgi:hypothetical protein